MMVGILVIGDNHFILSGPLPSEADAMELARHWSVIRIGADVSLSFRNWTIRTKEFRENLEWAVVAPGNGEMSTGVAELLRELAARGVEIWRYGNR